MRSERLTSGGIGYPVKVRLAFLMVTLAGGLAAVGAHARLSPNAASEPAGFRGGRAGS